MKTTILFDHDGVLVDTEPYYYRATKECVAPLGVDLTLERYLQDMPTGGSAWDQAAAAGASAEAIDRHRAQRNRLYQQYLQNESIEISGVENVLTELSSTYTLAIVTTSKPDDFELIHRHRKITQHMSLVLTNGDYPRSKPHPDPYLTALERLSVSAAEAVVVEDSERGLRSALAAGIDCIIVANHFVASQNFDGAAHHIDSLSELPALLATISSAS